MATKATAMGDGLIGNFVKLDRSAVLEILKLAL
jgi:hypothetical protein